VDGASGAQHSATGKQLMRQLGFVIPTQPQRHAQLALEIFPARDAAAEFNRSKAIVRADTIRMVAENQTA
jgi:hypothetical protein